MRVVRCEGPPWQVRLTAHLYRGEEWAAPVLAEWVRWALSRMPSAGVKVYRVESWGPAPFRGDGMDAHFPCAMVIVDGVAARPGAGRRVTAALLRGMASAESILSFRPQAPARTGPVRKGSPPQGVHTP